MGQWKQRWERKKQVEDGVNKSTFAEFLAQKKKHTQPHKIQQNYFCCRTDVLMRDSGEAWTSEGTWQWDHHPSSMCQIVGAHSLCWNAMLSFNAGVGTWSCPDLMCQTLLTRHLSLYPLGGVDGRWVGVAEYEEGWEGKLRLECKMKLKINKNI